VSGLTDRQYEIVRRLLDGQRVQGIARDLFLSPSTVRNHLSASYQKLGVTSQNELIEMLRARRNGER
jgi:DNA-binding CsgD family transcriptional regulator